MLFCSDMTLLESSSLEASLRHSKKDCQHFLEGFSSKDFRQPQPSAFYSFSDLHRFSDWLGHKVACNRRCLLTSSVS